MHCSGTDLTSSSTILGNAPGHPILAASEELREPTLRVAHLLGTEEEVASPKGQSGNGNAPRIREPEIY
jgi:hypothetical protein